MKWHGERVQRGSVPLHQRDHLIIYLPPFIFSQDFILAKSGLIRAAFTKLLPHFSQRGVKSYLQPPHNTIIYHKSSCCIYPTPHPWRPSGPGTRSACHFEFSSPPAAALLRKRPLCVLGSSPSPLPPPHSSSETHFSCSRFHGKMRAWRCLDGCFFFVSQRSHFLIGAEPELK